MVHGGDDAPVQQAFRLVTGPEYVQMELAALEAVRGPATADAVATAGRGRRRTARAAASRPSAERCRRPAGARVAFRAMFERTALPGGPRVISARMPGTRALAVAVYVLVGSRQEQPRPSGPGPLHGAHHVPGHARRCPRHVRCPRRSRAWAAPATRPRTASRPCLLGAPAGPRGRPRVRTSSSELVLRPCCASRTSPGSGTSSWRRSAPTGTTRASTSSTCSTRRSSATPRWAGRSRATRTRSGR